MASQHGHHVIPKKTLYTVFGALVFLTILTALTAIFVDIGAFNVPLALAIAGSKATLVVMFFMALKYDNRVNTLTFALGAIFVIVFLVFTLFDTAFRGDLGNVGAETISDIERRESVQRDREAGMERTTPPTAPGAEEPGAVADTADTTGAAETGESVDTTTAETDETADTTTAE